ncbi:Fic family protein [Rickettsiales endosymbiont of Trichoplax sp. H2]|uniref:Fic family protein n=1 Tax=Rickettsiales endosymbiont of Trichoplax sp. H2 TaxID=2021221 RepID=UPI001D48732C|nr:Fic family protein [Rickettsiales endosymbiont of Trichoplax sp. H2]MSO14432.1 Adenosine monophosphate-protein transferase ficd [Rickettsiales endosymbiont of Trichoplax sp. H2]
MGINIGVMQKIDRNVDGIIDIMFDATKNYYTSLTKNRLYGWHSALFPTGRSGMNKITVGSWRKKDSDIMQVISGPIGREVVHFEAPTYDRLNKEMQYFIKWFNSATKDDLVLKSAIAHLWFITIHPFADGNGRIGRALSDMLLAKSENTGKRFYSMSSQMQKDRKNYYLKLEKSQKGNLDITEWIIWFLDCLKKAIKASEDTLSFTLYKAKFWKEHEEIIINTR